MEKCELKPPTNIPLLPDIVPSFADGFDEACEKAAASMPGDLFPQMVSPVASPATLPDMGLSGVALRVAQAFGAEHGCGAAVGARARLTFICAPRWLSGGPAVEGDKNTHRSMPLPSESPATAAALRSMSSTTLESLAESP